MNRDHHKRGTYASYSIGFAFSLLFTFLAYFVVTGGAAASSAVPFIVLLAVAQLVVQLVFFQHLSAHREGRWDLTAFIFTALMLWFVVIGSLWIMNHLNSNMTPTQIDAYMHKQN
jgi:cytochrome o ubiquinol oxidase subunit IV